MNTARITRIALPILLTTSNQRSPPSGVLNVFFSFKPGTATPTSGVPAGPESDASEPAAT